MHVFSHLLALLLLVSLALSSLAIGESPCLDPDFEYTPENARLSSYVKAFERWNKDQIEKVPDKYKEIGMMNLFARQHWGGDNFECSVSLGCINRPECPYIFRELSTTILKDRSEVEIRDATRDIWFIVQAVIAINHQMNLIHQLLLAVQENMTAGLARIIGDFTPQADSTKDRQCELAKAAREVVISMLLDALDIGLAFMGVPGGGHIVGAAVNGGKEAAKNAAKEAIKKSQVAAKGAAGYAKVGKHSAEALADIGLNAHAMGQSVPVGSDNDQLRQLSIDAKVCGRDAWSVEENFKRFGQITRNLQVDFTSRRASNHGLINLLNDNMEGNDINTSNISMVRLMETTFWPKLSPKLKQNEALMEQQLTKSFTEESVSFALTQSKCYVKCKVYPENHKMCPWNHDKGFKKGRGSLDKYRVCYEDGTVCQMQCWPRHKADGNSNKEMKLYGLDKLLGHYKIEPTELVTNSYETWKKWHNFDIPNKFDPVVGSLKRNESALRLPVCFSQHNVLVDLDKKESRNFPFICGFFGSETRAVLDKINMKRSSVNGEMLQGKAADVFQNYIIPRMRYWSAVKRFVALCELDIHWPYKQHHKMVMTKGADKRCGEVKEAIEGLTELEANQWFCNEWKGRRQLKKDESMWIESKIPFPINHHRRCIDFRDNYKKKGAKLFPDQTKINMQANYTDQFLAEQHHNEALHESPSSESESVDVRDFAGAPSFPEAPSAPSDWPGQIMYGSSSGSPWNLTKASRLKYFPKSHKDETSGYH